MNIKIKWEQPHSTRAATVYTIALILFVLPFFFQGKRKKMPLTADMTSTKLENIAVGDEVEVRAKRLAQES